MDHESNANRQSVGQAWHQAREDPEPANSVEYLKALKRSEAGWNPAGGSSTAQVPSAGATGPVSERRREPRFKCAGSVEFRPEDSDVRTWATVTDISRGGCYVEMQATFPRDTRIRMVLDVCGIRMQAKAVVRVSYPFLGMGISFIEITSENQPRLEEILQRLSYGQAKPPEPPTPTSEEFAATADPRHVLNELTRFFQVNGTLTREEFAEFMSSRKP